MKEAYDSASVRVRRSGYEGSGFVFYFARCKDRKALAAYVSSLPGGEKLRGQDIPYGYSLSRATTVLPGVIPEAAGTHLWEAHMAVVAAGGKDKVTPVAERRHWHHEIGHTVEWFAAAHSEEVDRHTSMIQSASVKYEGTVEASAYCNEFLCECVDLMLMGSEAGAESGLPFVMPWCRAGGGK